MYVCRYVCMYVGMYVCMYVQCAVEFRQVPIPPYQNWPCTKLFLIASRF